MLKVTYPLQRSSPYEIGGIVLLTAVAVILAALGFEHIGGYTPCPLCLQQRYAYYAGIPALLAALYLVSERRSGAAAAIFAVVAIAFLINAALGTYQAGAEWGFWPPPATCSAPGELPQLNIGQDSLDRMPAGCGIASWRFLGLSFAGWNVVASLFLAAGAGAAALNSVGPRASR